MAWEENCTDIWIDRDLLRRPADRHGLRVFRRWRPLRRNRRFHRSDDHTDDILVELVLVEEEEKCFDSDLLNWNSIFLS